jgi:hypothetical protein
MTGESRPGALPSCPPWCAVDHSWPIHREHARDLGLFEYGTGRVSVHLVWDPQGFLDSYRVPRIALSAYQPETLPERRGADFIWISSPGDAEQLAGLMDVLDRPALAEAIREAAQMLGQTGPETGGPGA